MIVPVLLLTVSWEGLSPRPTERQSKRRKFKWRTNENMQGKDVQAASQTNVFTGTWRRLLQIPFSADHSMDIKNQEEHFLRSTYPCGPKSGSQTTSEINVQNKITLIGGYG